MILLIDNYDSFVHNLSRYFVRLGHHTRVIRNDQICASKVAQLDPDAIVLSPGPCGPVEAGNCLQIVKQCSNSIPILGVCLGHQVIAAAFGARIVRSNRPVHGQPADIYHKHEDLFRGLPSPFVAGRYHALVVDSESVPDCLQVTASIADGTIMALSHRERKIYGVQFHPESILSDCGFSLLRNFLTLAGLECRLEPSFESELTVPSFSSELPDSPVTF